MVKWQRLPHWKAPLERFQVRKAKAEDLSFIFSSWLKNYRHKSQFALQIPEKVYYSNHHRVVQDILCREPVEVLMAETPVDGTTIYIGYMVVERTTQPIVHFTYVKNGFRRMGVMKKLAQVAEVDLTKATFTHWTFAMDTLTMKWPAMRYDPYLAF